MSEQGKASGTPEYKGLRERLLYDPRVFLGATSALAVAVIVGWGVKAERVPRPSVDERAAAAPPISGRGFFAPQGETASALASARATAVPAGTSMIRPGDRGTGAAVGAALPDGPSHAVREAAGRLLEGAPAAGTAVVAPTTQASLDERIQEALRDHEKAEGGAPEAADPDPEKPSLRALDRFKNQKFISAGGSGGVPSPAAAPRAPEGRPVLQALGATSAARAAQARAFFRPSAGTRALPSAGANAAFSGRTLKGAGDTGAFAAGVGAAPGGRGERLSMVGAPSGAAETSAARFSAPRGGGVGGGAGGASSSGDSSKNEVKPATKAHILEEADKRLAAAERYKAAVVLPLVGAEWSEGAFPRLKEQARQAELRLRTLDSVLSAALPRFGDRPDVVAAFDEIHLMLSGDGRDEVGGNMAGRLRSSQERISAGLQDLALLPVRCAYTVQVRQPRRIDPAFPRAAAEDLPSLGFSLEPQASSWQCEDSTWGACEPVRYRAESVHDSARQAHDELDYAARQSYNVRLQALEASEAVPQRLAPMEAALRRTDPLRADALRDLGVRVRADLAGAAGLLPDPPVLARARGLSAVAAGAESARGEVRGLRDAFNGEYPGYPDTRSRRDASAATNEAFDGAQGAANTLGWFTGAAGQPLKGLVDAGRESVRTLVGLCDAYQSMRSLAADVK